MAIKWTVSDAIEHLKELKNPFERTETAQGTKLSDVFNRIASENGGKEVPDIEQRL